MSGSDALGAPREVDLSVGRLRYRERGEGPPIVFVHGIVANGDHWRKVVPPLAGAFRCIVPDLPLGSHELPVDPRADLSLRGLARLLDELLETLDLDEVTLVGNDTGGAICQAAAAWHPARIGRLALTSCDAFDNFLPPVLRHLQVLGRFPPLLYFNGQALRFAAVQRLPIALGRLTVRPIARERVSEYARPLRESRAVRRDFARLCRAISARDTEEAAEGLRSFERPALIAWGHEDRLFPLAHAHRLAALLPDARLVVIPGSGAFIPEDQPARLAELLADFAGRPLAAVG